MITVSRMLSAVAFATAVLVQPIHAKATGSDNLVFTKGAVPCSLFLGPKRMLWKDFHKIRTYAMNNRLRIQIFAPNPDSLPFLEIEGFKPKPEELKRCKTARSGRYAGLVTCPPSLFKNYAEFLAEKERLKGLGFEVLGEAEEYLALEDAKAFAADYDLVIMVDENGNNAFTEKRRNELNALLGRRMFRHGPLAEYEDRHLVGLKFPIVDFDRNGIVTDVTNETELRHLHKLNDLPWIW